MRKGLSFFLVIILLQLLMTSCESAPPTYKEMKCSANVQCWNKLLDSFFNTILVDLEAGAMDDKYYFGDGWYSMKSKIDKIVDEKIKDEIYKLVNEKIKKIEKRKQKVIMEEMRLEWY